MRGKAKRKVVTSGRLTGAVKVSRTPLTLNPGRAACPEPAYSLYSTDSEDQVTALHKGLDSCAALLSGILQAEKAASPSHPRLAKGGAAKSRPSSSLGKKTTKKPPTRTDQKSAQPGLRGPGTHRVKPPQKQPPTAVPPVQPETSVLLSVHQSSSPSVQLPLRQNDRRPASESPPTRCEAERDGGEESVPVRDHSATADAQTAVTRINACFTKMSDVQLETGQDDEVPEETHGAKTVQDLLGELKALIAGRDSVADSLLSQLELVVSSPQMNDGGSNIQTESAPSSLHIQNTQLRRRVRILNQQLKERERAARHQNLEVLWTSEELSLQEDLVTAQSRLQELQDDLAELREALRDTQSQLRCREEENSLLKTDLEATRSMLLDREREKSELASVAQQRLEEIGSLNRLLQSPSDRPPVVNSSASQHLSLQRLIQDPPAPPTDRIAHYLMSVGSCVPAEREGDASSHPDVRSHGLDGPAQTLAALQSRGLQLERARRQLFNSTLSQCDVESVWSDCSMKSGSTFDTRDEAAFRDGLAALDASIASLQETIHQDLRR